MPHEQIWWNGVRGEGGYVSSVKFAGGFEYVRDIEALTEQREAARLDAKEAEAYSVWLERRLAKAVEVLVLCRDMFDEVAHPSDPMSVLLNTTLAELEGDKP